MRILRDLDTSGLAEQYARTVEAIGRGDFRAGQVKKLTGHERLYRAKLDPDEVMNGLKIASP